MYEAVFGLNFDNSPKPANYGEILTDGNVNLNLHHRLPGHRLGLDHFGIENIGDLPGVDELKGAGLLQSQMPAGFAVPIPDDDPALTEDEDPFTLEDIEELGLLTPSGDS